ncbi:MAG: hypothetical protein IIA88_11225 [Bacteroidetes bacterium]|nr:hypothetical protein [Bacteroidota bacterium]
MNKHQRISTAKYLYDISKGIAILAVVGNIVVGKLDLLNLIFGFFCTAAFFIFAYTIEKRINND